MKKGRKGGGVQPHHKRWNWYCPNREELQGRVERVRVAWEGSRVDGKGISQAAVIELALRLGLGALEGYFGLVTPADHPEGSGSVEGGGAGSDASSEL